VAFLRDDRRGDGIGRRASKSDHISRFMFIITCDHADPSMDLFHQLSLRLPKIQSARLPYLPLMLFEL
jgi:hypothetical protein